MTTEPFPIRGWDIERFDPQYVVEMIHKAQQAGMNTISLSHEVVMNAEEILWDWHRYQHLRRFCDEAHRCGMQVYLWNHQINNPPEVLIRPPEGAGPRRLYLDDPRLWEWLADRYARVIARVPNFDGIILSLTESEFQVHRENVAVSSMSQPERMAKVIETVYRPLAEHGKRLWVRDFLRTPEEMGSFLEALARVSPSVGVLTKCVPNDWQYRYPPHPLLGRVAPHMQVMELDLYNETAGNRNLVMPAPRYYQEQLRRARDLGLAGAVGRCDDGFRSNAGTPAAFNIFAYSRLLHDPDADIGAMWQEFFVPFYGEAAAAVAIGVLEKCFDLVCALRYTLGFWTGDHMASVAYTDSRLVNNSSARWSDDPKYAITERFLLNSGPETIRAVVAEKEQARRTAEHCLEELERHQALFEPVKFAQLQGYFTQAVWEAKLGALWERAYFALRWYRNTRQEAAYCAAKEALDACRAYLDRIPPGVTHRMPAFIEEVERELRAV